MKKGISILLVVLMLAAMLHLSVAIHYCDGKVAASTVSLSGKLAICGMECSEKGLPLPGTNFTKHCCDNIVTFCGIDSLSLIHISEPTRRTPISYAVFCL